VPRTASTSLALALTPYLTPIQSNNHTSNYAKGKYDFVHYTPTEAIDILDILGIPLSKSFKMIMIVRNPYDRILSLYNHTVEYFTSIGIKSFDEFIDVLDARSKNDSIALSLLSTRKYDSQLTWVNDPNNFNMHTFKYENLNDGLIEECLTIPKLDIPQENFNKVHANGQSLSPDQKHKIYSIYQEEFEVFQYTS
jgi:hypothetical protein